MSFWRFALVAGLLVGCGIGGVPWVEDLTGSGHDAHESADTPDDGLPSPAKPGMPSTGTEVGNPVASVDTVHFTLTVESLTETPQLPTDETDLPIDMDSPSTSGPRPADATVLDDDGRRYRLIAAFAQVKEARLTFAEDRHCDEIRDQLAGGARCEHESVGDDDDDDDDDDDELDEDDDDRHPHHWGKKTHKLIIDGPTVADLLDGTTDPSWEEVRVPATEYEKAEVKLTKKADLLGGASFVAEALFDRPDGRGEGLLILRLEFDDKLKYDDPDQAVQVMSDGSLIATLDASVWLEGTPLDECIADGTLPIVDGVVIVDSASDSVEDCKDVEKAIRDNIKRSAKLAGR